MTWINVQIKICYGCDLRRRGSTGQQIADSASGLKVCVDLNRLRKSADQIAVLMFDAAKMRSLRSLCVVIAVCCVCSIGAQDQVVKVSLDKRVLNLDAFAPQKRAEQLKLLHSSNAGEDIPILNFLDAQVLIFAQLSLTLERCVRTFYAESVSFLCSTMGRLALAVPLKTSWSFSTPAALTCGCLRQSAAGLA